MLRILQKARIIFFLFQKNAVYIISGLFILYGIILRFRQFLFNRSLWFDEAALALNLINRSYTELTKPLDYNQGAPLGFLFVEKLMISLFGPSEFALRLFPLICSITSLLIFFFLVKHILHSYFIPLSLLFISISPNLIYYSSEVKQYSTDVFIILVLAFLAIGIITKGFSFTRLLSFGLLGIISIWFSHPALFLLAGAGLYFLLFSLINIKWEQIPWILTLGLFWLLSFGLVYSISLSSLGENENLVNFWRNYFAPFPPTSVSDIRWYINALNQVFTEVLKIPFPKITLLLSIIGVIALMISNQKILWIILSPLPFLILASAIEKYPIYGRFILFYLPMILIFIVKGFEFISGKFSLRASILVMLIIGILLYPQIPNSINIFLNPITKEEIKPIIEYVCSKKQPGDVVYVYYGSHYAFEFYNKRYHINNYVIGVSSRTDPEKYFEEIDNLPRNKRIWFIFSHVYNGKFGNEEELLVDFINKRWKQTDHITAPGASGYLYVSP